jgi:hypothetical protein
MSALTNLMTAFQQITLSDAVTEIIVIQPKPIRHCAACGQEGHTNVSKSCPKRISLPSIVESARAPILPTIVSVPAVPTIVSDIDPSMITTFFKTSTRDNNDATNAIRERIIGCLSTSPFLDDPIHGPAWRTLVTAWDAAVREVAEKTQVPAYDRVTVSMKGGRGYHYDADLQFHTSDGIVLRMIEFKYGATQVTSLPQFLSLQAKFPMFEVTYDAFYYDYFLDRYLGCDEGLTETKLSREDYLHRVTATTYHVPFFQQLKEREDVAKQEKNRVVNESITAYLETHGPSMNLTRFSEKLQESQTGKIYLLWSKGAFHVDVRALSKEESLTYHGIKGGNVLQIQQGGIQYHLLLRWRNHKGILNPAWQIKLVRSV